jgi:lipopolysaccharide transport system ATP-binding protein
MPSSPGCRRPSNAGAATAAGPEDDTIWALKDVSFEVKRGEVVGVIGRNGAGKSHAAQDLDPDYRTDLRPGVLNGRVGSLLEVGTGFHQELTGRENIYLSGAILGMRRTEIDRKFDEIVDFSGVEKFIDTPVKRYSSGMKVRLGFAVAAHLEPEILLIDEVWRWAMQRFRRSALGKMGDVANEGRTVLFVSHNMASVNALCTRGVWLEKGRIQCIGKIDSVIDRYQSVIQTASETHLESRVDRRGHWSLQVRYNSTEFNHEFWR